MSPRTSCIQLVRVSSDQLASFSRLSIAQRYNGVLTLAATRAMSKNPNRLATQLWAFLGMAHMRRCFVATRLCLFRSRWYIIIPPCCVVTRSPSRHSISAPPRKGKRNNTMASTHARSNSILVDGTSVVPSGSMSRRTTSARTSARSKSWPVMVRGRA
jgi:hypothetical protein